MRHLLARWHLRRAFGQVHRFAPLRYRHWHFKRARALSAALTASVTVYNVGDLAQLTASFTDASTGDADDPTTVTFTVRAPDGTITTPDATKTATGKYTAQVSCDQGGGWLDQVDGTGAVQAAAQSSFYVQPKNF